jgi:hypothetical protein
VIEKTNQDDTPAMTPAMTPERWQRIKGIFDQVVEAETGRRGELLDTACDGDAALRDEVEKLLRGHQEASSFIEQPAMPAMPAVANAARLFEVTPDDALVGAQVGPYKVLREIGHGGMGQVYLAVRDDDEYKKRVALKSSNAG